MKTKSGNIFDYFGDSFGRFENQPSAAFEDGKSATPRKCETLTELGDWFQGFSWHCHGVTA